MPLGEIMWHLSTHVNGSDIAAYITVFDPRRDKRRRFIHFMVNALVYLSVASRRGPAQDVPFDLILWYTAKTIPTLLE